MTRRTGFAALLGAAAAGLLTGAGVARADEPLFGYVNTTDFQPGYKLEPF